MNKFTQFGMRTGHVMLEDYDLAVIRKTGALLDRQQNEWYLPIQGQYIQMSDCEPTPVERALVVFKRPEPTQVEHKIPQIAIIRDDIDPAEERLYSPTTQYRVPAAGARRISIGGALGFDCYETRDKDQPYNFSYTIEVWARYLTVAQYLLQRMMRQFPLRGTLDVNAREEDTRNVLCVRTYLFTQVGIANLTEVNSMVERIPGFGMSIRVEGELSLDRVPQIERAFTGTTSTDPIPGTPEFPGGNPNLPNDGLYGNGLPNVRVSRLED